MRRVKRHANQRASRVKAEIRRERREERRRGEKDLSRCRIFFTRADNERAEP